ncbi:restriction endonuclease subunit S [Halolamina salina]|uniref:Restriction endonuclease subunit S n=1 Tax=Halolamina salina TaxID=1220023 RepID=A0ABD6B6P1_9EURY
MNEESTLSEFVPEESDKQEQKWEEVQLHEVAYKRSDNVDPQEVELEKHIGLEHIDPNDPVPDWESLDDLSSTKRRFETGDILFAKLRPNLEKSAQPDFEGVASTDIFPIVAESDVNSKWLLYRLSSKPAYDYARRTSAGTRMPRTSWNLFSNFNFLLPPLPEQRKIATVLYTVDQAIEKTEKMIEGTKQIQRGVEQHLFREGYFDHDTIEQTRLVTIPGDWNFDQLSEHTKESAFGPRFGSERYDEDGEIATLRTTDLDDNGHIDLDDMPVADLEYDEVEEHILKPGDFMITRSGTTGIGTVWENHHKPTIPGAFLIRFRFKDSLNPNFMKYYVNSSLGRRRVNRRAKGGVQKNLAGSDLLNMRFPIPTEEEQEKIIEVLDTYQARIQHEKDYKSQLQALKQGLMQDLLSGKVRTTNTNIEVPEEIAQHG